MSKIILTENIVYLLSLLLLVEAPSCFRVETIVLLVNALFKIVVLERSMLITCNSYKEVLACTFNLTDIIK